MYLGHRRPTLGSVCRRSFSSLPVAKGVGGCHSLWSLERKGSLREKMPPQIYYTGGCGYKNHRTLRGAPLIGEKVAEKCLNLGKTWGGVAKASSREGGPYTPWVAPRRSPSVELGRSLAGQTEPARPRLTDTRTRGGWGGPSRHTPCTPFHRLPKAPPRMTSPPPCPRGAP